MSTAKSCSISAPRWLHSRRVRVCLVQGRDNPALTIEFLWRVRYHLKRAGLKREELSYNILATGRVPGLG